MYQVCPRLLSVRALVAFRGYVSGITVVYHVGEEKQNGPGVESFPEYLGSLSVCGVPVRPYYSVTGVYGIVPSHACSLPCRRQERRSDVGWCLCVWCVCGVPLHPGLSGRGKSLTLGRVSVWHTWSRHLGTQLTHMKQTPRDATDMLYWPRDTTFLQFRTGHAATR